MPTISEIKSSAFGGIFKRLAAKTSFNLERTKVTAQGVWRNFGSHGLAPATLTCDADLITLGLAKDEQGVVYMKFDLSGWDE
ncbi:MAG: hypothetical protein JSV19_01025 [Phycisphaerales bacterium]|nr:MAG: hypothetical protein JSV19_01025 [Phycisphaerales bacterium]